MDSLELVRPTLALEREFMEMARDWQESGDSSAPWYCIPEKDFPAMITKQTGYAKGIGLPEGYVPNTTFWLVLGRRVLGAVNIRHGLNEFLLGFGGQIGYGVRPCERRKGYGTALLRLALAEAARLGLSRVLVCCYQDNTGSAKVIERNGGVLEDRRDHNGRTVLRYWIDLADSGT